MKTKKTTTATPYLDNALKQIKKAKSDKKIKMILAEIGSAAVFDSQVANECLGYIKE
jgi:hypothetical protein